MDYTKLGNKYTRVITKKPIAFISYFVVGLFIIIYLMLLVKTDVTQVYSNIDLDKETKSVTIAKDVQNSKNIIYIYEDRNVKVVKADIVKAIHEGGKSKLFLKLATNDDLNDFARGDTINAEVPVKTINLFERIFLRGGKKYQ